MPSSSCSFLEFYICEATTVVIVGHSTWKLAYHYHHIYYYAYCNRWKPSSAPYKYTFIPTFYFFLLFFSINNMCTSRAPLPKTVLMWKSREEQKQFLFLARDTPRETWEMGGKEWICGFNSWWWWWSSVQNYNYFYYFLCIFPLQCRLTSHHEANPTGVDIWRDSPLASRMGWAPLSQNVSWVSR